MEILCPCTEPRLGTSPFRSPSTVTRLAEIPEYLRGSRRVWSSIPRYAQSIQASHAVMNKGLTIGDIVNLGR